MGSVSSVLMPQGLFTKAQTLPSTPVIDGFMYNPHTRYWPNAYAPLALTNVGMEVLRRANLLRPRWYVLPDAQSTPIAAYETFENQVQVTAGSYLWGLTYIEFAVEGDVLIPSTGANGLINIVDSCTGVSMTQDYMVGRGVGSFGTAGSRNPMSPQLLSQPRIISAPGLINVEIANKSGSDLNCQLVLFTAEPCVEVKSGGRAYDQPQVAAPIPGTYQGAAVLTGNRKTLTYPGAPQVPGVIFSPENANPGYVPAATPQQIAAQGGNPAGPIPGVFGDQPVFGQVYQDEAGNAFYWTYDDAGNVVPAYFPLPQNPVTSYFD